jgi:hypothetical protein
MRDADCDGIITAIPAELATPERVCGSGDPEKWLAQYASLLRPTAEIECDKPVARARPE